MLFTYLFLAVVLGIVGGLLLTAFTKNEMVDEDTDNV